MNVLDRLRRQLEKYREMADVVVSERSAFVSMDVDAVLGGIERKRAILSEIETLEAELAPAKADWARVRAALPSEEARAIEATLEETQTVLRELVRLEDESRALLDRRREESTAALDRLMSRGRARSAYGAR